MDSKPICALLFLFSLFFSCRVFSARPLSSSSSPTLRFSSSNGEFKILQVADMHYADGKSTLCEDVLPEQVAGCSDLNTTAFIQRMIKAEKPDLIVFTGDNIFGFDATDAAKSLDAAFAPAIAAKIPWAAVLGNHDQESTLNREQVMKHIVPMEHTLSRLNPAASCSGEKIDGFGNYNLEVSGVTGSKLENKSVLNLYFLDSGDYSTVSTIPGYGWIKPSQQLWFQRKSSDLQKKYTSEPEAQTGPAPGLVYFHIPLPEFGSFDASNFTGVKQEGISSASINSGFFTTMVEAGDVKAVFTGHDHVNDFCGKLTGINLCYAGGFGYHAYGKAGWSRRARVVLASLEKKEQGTWGGVKSIKTWKRLDDQHLSTIDFRTLWVKSSTVAAVFSLAYKLQPAIIFIDEVDSFLGQRRNTDHEALTNMKTEFMALWDGFTTDQNARVMVLAATNRPQELDEAILRRLPQAFEIGIPSCAERVKILKVILKGEKVEDDIDYDHIANLCEGFTGSDLLELCKQAAYFPLRDLLHDEKNGQGSHSPRALMQSDLENTLSVSKKAKVVTREYGSSTQSRAVDQDEYQDL